MATIADLQQLMPNPDFVTPKTAEQWNDFEQQLGTAVPAGYKEYINLYELGIIGNFLIIHNPFTRDDNFTEIFYDNVNRLQDHYTHLRDLFPKDFSLSLFPNENGLLQFGRTISGDYLFWQTSQDVDDWTVNILSSDYARYEVTNLQTIDFLISYIKNDLKSSILIEVGVFELTGADGRLFLPGKDQATESTT